MKYRAELDGLRGISVAVVVFFHASIASFSGGYVGVDVFFVISGYLITTIILQEQEAGAFSFQSFYERRVRRLMPALATMLIVITPLSMWVLLPDELVAYGRNLIEALLSVLNIFLWRDTGYFEVDAVQRPLLHLWSLSVEEQFYLIWPFLLWSLNRRFERSTLRWVVLAIIALSLATSQWAAANAPGAAFYLTPSRAWEPMLGALVALVPVGPAIKAVRESAALIGMLMLSVAVISFDQSTTFPGLNALLPCVGTALIIYAGIEKGIIYFNPLTLARELSTF